MHLALDYDDTYTRDPTAWNSFIKFMRDRGHKVYIVTYRDDSQKVCDEIGDISNGIYFTSHVAKEQFMAMQGIRIDVWIDDNPRAIIYTMEN